MAGGPQIDPRLEKMIENQEEEDRQREKEAQEKHVRRCYYSVFTSADGKVVLSDLRNLFYDVDGYVPGSPADSHALSCTRNVVLRILTLLKEESEAPKEPQREAEI